MRGAENENVLFDLIFQSVQRVSAANVWELQRVEAAMAKVSFIFIYLFPLNAAHSRIQMLL